MNAPALQSESQAVEPPAIENPLRESRLNSSQDYRPEWDVPSLNEHVSKTLLAEIRLQASKRRTKPDPAQLIRVLLSATGYGKTHLFGRLEHLLGDLAFFVYVPAVEDTTRPLEHIRWHVVEAFFRPRLNRLAVVEFALLRLCLPSFRKYFEQFSPSLAETHHVLIREVRAGGVNGARAALEIVRSIRDRGYLAPFLRLADSMGMAIPAVPATVTKAIGLAWSPAADSARRWLRGEGLPDEELKRLGLPPEPPSPSHVLQGIAAVLHYTIPTVICCDQMESLLKDKDGPRLFTAQLMEVLHAVPNLFMILGCIESEWPAFESASFSPVRGQRFHPPLRLKHLDGTQAVELISRRLRGWPAAQSGTGGAWPFDEASIATYADRELTYPRGFIQRCSAALDEWVRRGRQDPINLNGRVPVAPPPNLFLNEWNEELEAIRHDPKRSAAHTQEERLFRAVFLALALAGEAGWDCGGGRIGKLTQDVVRPGGRAKRYSVKADLVPTEQDAGGPGWSVVLPVTKLDQGSYFLHYFGAMMQAVADPSTYCLLVHEKASFAMGRATQQEFEKAQKAGKLRLFVFSDHRPTFERIECYLRFLDKALSGDLTLGGKTISVEECKRLVVEARVLEGLDLFKLLGGWALSVAPAPSAPEASPAILGAAAESNEQDAAPTGELESATRADATAASGPKAEPIDAMGTGPATTPEPAAEPTDATHPGPLAILEPAGELIIATGPEPAATPENVRETIDAAHPELSAIPGPDVGPIDATGAEGTATPESVGEPVDPAHPELSAIPGPDVGPIDATGAEGAATSEPVVEPIHPAHPELSAIPGPDEGPFDARATEGAATPESVGEPVDAAHPEPSATHEPAAEPIVAPATEPAATPELVGEPTDSAYQEPSATLEEAPEPIMATAPEPTATPEPVGEAIDAAYPEPGATLEAAPEPIFATSPEAAATPAPVAGPTDAAHPEPSATLEAAPEPIVATSPEAAATPAPVAGPTDAAHAEPPATFKPAEEAVATSKGPAATLGPAEGPVHAALPELAAMPEPSGGPPIGAALTGPAMSESAAEPVSATRMEPIANPEPAMEATNAFCRDIAATSGPPVGLLDTANEDGTETPAPTPPFAGSSAGAWASPAVSPALPEGAPVAVWAAQKLDRVVEKLGQWGQPVTADGCEIAPAFARLRVRPEGIRTTFRRIADKAEDLRIMLALQVAPIIGPQAGYISIDIQRPNRDSVALADVLRQLPPPDGRPIFPVGLDVAGKAHTLNLADASDCHLLVAGSTGSGKSEFLRSMVAGLAARLSPEQLRFILIDPRRVTFNIGPAAGPYLMHPPAHFPRQAAPLIRWCIEETQRRYESLAQQKLTDVSQLPDADRPPRVVVVVDEFASLMVDKEATRALLEDFRQIGSLSRAAGIHLVIATHRPDKDILAPLLRDNLPGRIALSLFSKANSDLVIGSPEAKYLLGKGDLLWKRGGSLLRLQGPLVSQKELAEYLKVSSWTQATPNTPNPK